MKRLLILLSLLAVVAVAAPKSPTQFSFPKSAVSDSFRQHEPVHTVQIRRGSNGDFAVQAKINGIAAPMVVDTGATSVVLTYETAKAVGVPLELLEYNVEVQTAGGQTKAARLWLDRMAIGKLVERSVQALVVPRGQMKTNLLGMSFLDRLESWGVRAEKLMLNGYPETTGSIGSGSQRRDRAAAR